MRSPKGLSSPPTRSVANPSTFSRFRYPNTCSLARQRRKWTTTSSFCSSGELDSGERSYDFIRRALFTPFVVRRLGKNALKVRTIR